MKVGGLLWFEDLGALCTIIAQRPTVGTFGMPWDFQVLTEDSRLIFADNEDLELADVS